MIELWTLKSCLLFTPLKSPEHTALEAVVAEEVW